MLLPDQLLIKKLRCPACSATNLSLMDSQSLLCGGCSRTFVKREGIWNLIEYTDASQKEIQAFWGDLYQQLYDGQDRQLESSTLYRRLKALKQMLENFEQPIGMEIDLSSLRGKEVLEIGCGSGGHSCLMKRWGANLTSIDITPERVLATQKKLGLVREGTGVALGANAEKLPFRDDFFDLVYSFGVLHHTPNTQAAIDEVYRVTKPGGRAVIMLYAKSSFYYLVLLLKGILTGSVFKGNNWLGRVTEGKPRFRNTYNPYTRCYTAADLTKMFSRFRNARLRKNGFNLSQIPSLGRQCEKWLVRRGISTESDGGLLVWDRPLRLILPIEQKLGRKIGFGFNICCEK